LSYHNFILLGFYGVHGVFSVGDTLGDHDDIVLYGVSHGQKKRSADLADYRGGVYSGFESV